LRDEAFPRSISGSTKREVWGGRSGLLGSWENWAVSQAARQFPHPSGAPEKGGMVRGAQMLLHNRAEREAGVGRTKGKSHNKVLQRVIKRKNQAKTQTEPYGGERRPFHGIEVHICRDDLKTQQEEKGSFGGEAKKARLEGGQGQLRPFAEESYTYSIQTGDAFLIGRGWNRLERVRALHHPCRGRRGVITRGRRGGKMMSSSSSRKTISILDEDGKRVVGERGPRPLVRSWGSRPRWGKLEKKRKTLRLEGARAKKKEKREFVENARVRAEGRGSMDVVRIR